MMLTVQKDKESGTTRPLFAAACVLESILLHSSLNRAARPISSRLKSLCSRLSCTGQCAGTNNKDFFFCRGLDGPFSGSSKAWSPKRDPHIYTCTLNTASGTDQFTHTKTDPKAGECRNVMFDVIACASSLHVSAWSAVVFFSLILFSSHTVTPWGCSLGL